MRTPLNAETPKRQRRKSAAADHPKRRLFFMKRILSALLCIALIALPLLLRCFPALA